METKQKQSISPYNYQKEALENLTKDREESNNSALLKMAPGTGKTITSAFDTKQFNADRVLFIAHQKEILEQARLEFQKVYDSNIDCGILSGDKKEFNSRFTFATRQSLSQKNNLNNYNKRDFDYIIVDEFHHAQSTEYQKILDYFEPNFLLGLTATPYLIDVKEKDLLNLIQRDSPSFSYELDDAVTNGDLAKFEAKIYEDNINYEEAPEDLSEQDLNRKLFMPKRNKYIANKWLEEAKNRKTIAFCRNIKHSKRTAKHFREKGIKAKSVHSEISRSKRDFRIRQFRKGELDILTGVDIFNEGVDFPEVSALISMRPTTSKRVFRQQLGRGLRKSSNKEDCLVLDFVNDTNYERLDFYGADRTKTEYETGICQECESKSNYIIENECKECRTKDFVIETDIGKVKAEPEAMFNLADAYQEYRFNKDGYTEEELLEKLKEANKVVDGQLTTEKLNNLNDFPYDKNYSETFGSWTKALREAGLETPYKTYTHLSKKEIKKKIITNLRKAYENKKSNSTLSISEYQNFDDAEFGVSKIQDVFGTWSRAKKAANLQVLDNVEEKDIITGIKELKNKKKNVTLSNFTHETGISQYWIELRFGSWSEAKKAAGLKSNSKPSNLSKKKVLQKMKEFSKKYNLSASNFTEKSTLSSSTAQNKFGSWSEAKDLAKQCVEEDKTPEEVLEENGYEVE